MSFSWRFQQSLSLARAFAATTTLRNKWYVIGGTPAYTSAERYDPLTNTWTTLAAPAERTMGAAGSIAGKVYVFGGLDSTGNPLNTTQIYDPYTNSWSSGPTSPTVYGGAACNHEDRSSIYLFGGYFRTTGTAGAGSTREIIWPIDSPIKGGPGTGGSGGFTDSISSVVYIFDGTSWAAAGSTIQPCAFAASCRVGETFYIAGGNGGSSPSSVSMTWTTTNTSATLINPISIKSYLTGATVGTNVYFFAGGNASVTDTVDRQVVCYDTVLQAWTIDSRLNTGRLGASAAMLDYGRTPETGASVMVQRHGYVGVNQNVYTIGGESWINSGGTNSSIPSNLMQIVTPSSGGVLTIALPSAVTHPEVTVCNGAIYILGDTAGVAAFYKFDVGTNVFTALPTYGANARKGGAFGVSGTTLYFMENTGAGTETVRTFNTTTLAWATLGPTTPFAGTDYLGGAVIGTNFWVIAGPRAWQYDLTNNTWTSRASSLLSDPRFYVDFSGTLMHCLTYDTGEHWTYDTVNNKWNQIGQLINQRYYGGIAHTQDGTWHYDGGFPQQFAVGTPATVSTLTSPPIPAERWTANPVLYVTGGRDTTPIMTSEANGGTAGGDPTGAKAVKSSGTFVGLSFDDTDPGRYSYAFA
jgi:hypothetical protein